MSDTIKVDINKCYGGYGLSREAYEELGLEWDNRGYKFDKERDNIRLIEVVEKLGDRCNGETARLKIVEIPADVKWTIEEDEGYEWVAEVHRIWD